MTEEPFLEKLTLAPRPLIAVQLLASVFIIVVAVSAVYVAPVVIDNTHSDFKPLKQQPPLWLIITFGVLAFIPGIFVFNLIKENLNFVC